MRVSHCFLMILILAGVSTPVAAQAPEDSKADEILEDRGRSPRGQSFTYDPGNRRDPFMPLADLAEQEEGPRPPGAAGMAVDELDLAGVVETPDGTGVAYVTGSDGKGYMLRVGDRVFKAVVLAIDARGGTMTLREQSNDPRLIKPYRDRVLRLVPVEAGGN